MLQNCMDTNCETKLHKTAFNVTKMHCRMGILYEYEEHFCYSCFQFIIVHGFISATRQPSVARKGSPHAAPLRTPPSLGGSVVDLLLAGNRSDREDTMQVTSTDVAPDNPQIESLSLV